MYKAFFKLSRNPFELTPDPHCFVPTRHHDEALASLYYGVRRHKGLVVVTGEVGTGKTLLLRCLLRLLEQSKDVAYAYVFNSTLSPTEFLEYAVSDFGLSAAGKNKCELLTELSRFLIARGTKQMTTVLIVDEAHQLSPETLEEIRLLSNLETSTEKLLQIMLVGQPELDEKLDSVGLRQLKQRIALRTKLVPLTAEETKTYIEKRLRISGADPNAAQLFSPHAIAKVHLYSQGLPRLINTLCENSLITAYARRVSLISAEIVEQVAKEFRLDIAGPAQGGGAEFAGERSSAQQTASPLERRAALRGAVASESGLKTPVAFEVRGYESDI